MNLKGRLGLASRTSRNGDTYNETTSGSSSPVSDNFQAILSSSRPPLSTQTLQSHGPIEVPPQKGSLAARVARLQRDWEERRQGETMLQHSKAALNQGSRSGNTPAGLRRGHVPVPPERSPGTPNTYVPIPVIPGQIRKRPLSKADEQASQHVAKRRQGSYSAAQTDSTRSSPSIDIEYERQVEPVSPSNMHFLTSAELLERILQEEERVKQLEKTNSPASNSDKAEEGHRPAQDNASYPLPLWPPTLSGVHYMATADRAYTQFPDVDGQKLLFRRMLFPPGYKYYTKRNMPYICSVRECRRIFDTMYRLEQHFSASHNGKTFNDNGDGTVTMTKVYSQKGLALTPAVVTSLNPLPPDAEPPAEPGTPAEKTAASHARARNSGRDEKRMDLSPSQRFLHKQLSRLQQVPTTSDVQELRLLPLRRWLPKSWGERHIGRELDAANYACALAYMVGEEVRDDRFKCKNLSTFLSTTCVAMPPELSRSAYDAFGLDTCVGCRYSNANTKSSILESCDWDSTRPPLGHRKPTESAVNSPSIYVGDAATDQLLAESIASTRERRLRGTTSAVQPIATKKVQKDSGSASYNPSHRDDDDLEMEEWEVAPGRITASSSSDNVGFSSGYVTTSEPVVVSPDISFNVVIVRPGNRHQWPPATSSLRNCSVTAGKARVDLGGQKFQLGPNGLIVIRPGQTCTVENRLYGDLVIHCTTVKNYELMDEET